MPLTDAAIKRAKSRDRDWKLADEKGLYLLITPHGSKLWRLKYRHCGIERKLAFGPYPDVGLKEARRRRDDAREKIALGHDPARLRRASKAEALASAANSFEAVAAEYIEKCAREGRAEATISKANWFLTLLGPAIGGLPVATITSAELLAALRKVEGRGNRETARRLRSFASRVFRYAIATARAHVDPAQPLAGALAAPLTKHHAAITDVTRLAELLRAVDGYTGQPSTIYALRLAPHVFQRPGELRKSEWSEIDFARSVWTIPVSKMKVRGRGRTDHHVPLSRQSVAMLRELHAITGRSRYLFPSRTSPLHHLSENTVNAALRRLGFGSDEVTGHGFRTTASTFLYESGDWSSDAIERSLAHVQRDQVRAAYDRSEKWHERVQMSQWWSDFLDRLKSSADVVHLVPQTMRAAGSLGDF